MARRRFLPAYRVFDSDEGLGASGRPQPPRQRHRRPLDPHGRHERRKRLSRRARPYLLATAAALLVVGCVAAVLARQYALALVPAVALIALLHLARGSGALRAPPREKPLVQPGVIWRAKRPTATA